MVCGRGTLRRTGPVGPPWRIPGSFLWDLLFHRDLHRPSACTVHLGCEILLFALFVLIVRAGNGILIVKGFGHLIHTIISATAELKKMLEEDGPLPSSAASTTKAPAKKKRVLEEGDCLKAIIRSGADEAGKPQEGDLVVFHYTTYTEDGTVVESTRIEHGGTGVPFKLVLGKSKMIAAWEEALPTMAKGEVSRFKVKEKLHFGDPDCPIPTPENFPTTGILQFDIDMIDFFKVQAVTDDLGVLKQVLRAGDGWETAREPYEVRIRVTGRVPDGATFIVREEEPLHFALGRNEVPAGLEKGIGTMNKNEKAIIHVLNSLYITQASAIPQLPTQAQELQFEVELIQIIQVRDILGNGQVIKRRVKDGIGEFPVDCPLQDSTLRIHWRGKLPQEGGRAFHDTRLDGKPYEFCSGEGMLPEGLEMSVRLMLPGEIAVVTSTSKYAYENFPSRDHRS